MQEGSRCPVGPDWRWASEGGCTKCGNVSGEGRKGSGTYGDHECYENEGGYQMRVDVHYAQMISNGTEGLTPRTYLSRCAIRRETVSRESGRFSHREV